MTRHFLAGTTIRVWLLPTWLIRPLRAVLRPITGGEVAAFTLGHLVVALGEPTAHVLYHEAVHARQSEAYLCTLSYWVAYLWETVRHGYAHNRFEMEAVSETEAVIWCLGDDGRLTAICTRKHR